MTLGPVTAALALLAGLGLASGIARADDAELGRVLFEPCRACHSLDPAAPAMAGPKLAGLLGRKVAGDPDFDYSPVLRQAGAEGEIWTPERLDAFLADPEAMYPGLWMSNRGPRDPGQRAALIRFLVAPEAR